MIKVLFISFSDFVLDSIFDLIMYTAGSGLSALLFDRTKPSSVDFNKRCRCKRFKQNSSLPLNILNVSFY